MQQQFFAPEAPVKTTLPLPHSADMQTMEDAPTAKLLEMETAQTLPTTQAVADFLAQAQIQIRRRKYLTWAFVAVFNVIPLVEVFSWMIPGYNEWRAAHLSLWGLLLLGPIAALLVYMRVCSKKRNINADEMMQKGGINAIPVLLEATMGGASKPDHQSYLRVLATLLPRLQAADSPLLTRRHRRKLNMLLKPNTLGDDWVKANQELAVPLLKAYEQVGDADALLLVERLVNKKPRNARDHDIQQAAQACLPLLQARVGSLQPKEVLLRAASANTAGLDVLLRPAVSSSPTHGEELLRPTDTDNPQPLA